jgi:hypothetical protein
VVPVEPDVPNAGGGDEAQDPLHHAQSGAQNGHQRELLAAYRPAAGGFEWRVHGGGLQQKIPGRLVRHEHGDLVHQLLELLGGGRAIAQQRDLVAHQRVVDDAERREVDAVLGMSHIR